MELNDFRIILYVVFFLTICQTVAQAQSGNVTATTEAGSTPTSNRSSSVTTPPVTRNTTGSATSVSPTISTPSADQICEQHNASCAECLGVSGAKCLWCNSDNACKAYPLSKVLPPKDLCALDQARWGVCWLNFEALIIGVSTVGGIIILTITCCCVYCCCCRKGGRRKYEKEDARYNAQKMERKAKSDERRAERKERLDEIRRKYGLMKDEPYQRFES